MVRRAFPLLMWAVALSAAVMPCAAADALPSADAADRPEVNALTRLAEKLAAPDTTEESQTRARTPSAETVPAEGEDRPLGLIAASTNESRPLGSDGTSRDDSEWVLNTLTSLGLVIGLILLARWGWSKMGGTVAARGSSVVEVLSRTTVAPRNHVLLLRVGGRVLVVGDSTAGLRTLASIEDPDEVAGVLEAVTAAKGNSITNGFSQLLSHTDRDFSSHERLAEEGGDDGEYRFDRARDSVSSLLSRIRAISQKGGV